jgi:hypothetical protein
MKKKSKRWTLKDLCKHISLNVKDYSSVVVVSALYKKLYGEFPKGIGLSGCQADFADSILPKLPKRIINDLYEQLERAER